MLGKRLGKEMAAVAKAVTAMTSAQIAEYERTGTVHVGGAQLHAGEIKVGAGPLHAGTAALLTAASGKGDFWSGF